MKDDVNLHDPACKQRFDSFGSNWDMEDRLMEEEAKEVCMARGVSCELDGALHIEGEVRMLVRLGIVEAPNVNFDRASAFNMRWAFWNHPKEWPQRGASTMSWEDGKARRRPRKVRQTGRNNCQLFVVRCLLSVVTCLLFVVSCQMYAVCCLLSVVICPLRVVCCVLFAVCVVLSIASSMLSVVCCWLPVVKCQLSMVGCSCCCCRSFLVMCYLSGVTCRVSHVWCQLSIVTC